MVSISNHFSTFCSFIHKMSKILPFSVTPILGDYVTSSCAVRELLIRDLWDSFFFNVEKNLTNLIWRSEWEREVEGFFCSKVKWISGESIFFRRSGKDIEWWNTFFSHFFLNFFLSRNLIHDLFSPSQFFKIFENNCIVVIIFNVFLCCKSMIKFWNLYRYSNF